MELVLMMTKVGWQPLGGLNEYQGVLNLIILNAIRHPPWEKIFLHHVSVSLRKESQPSGPASFETPASAQPFAKHSAHACFLSKPHMQFWNSQGMGCLHPQHSKGRLSLQLDLWLGLRKGKKVIVERTGVPDAGRERTVRTEEKEGVFWKRINVKSSNLYESKLLHSSQNDPFVFILTALGAVTVS